MLGFHSVSQLDAFNVRPPCQAFSVTHTYLHRLILRDSLKTNIPDALSRKGASSYRLSRVGRGYRTLALGRMEMNFDRIVERGDAKVSFIFSKILTIY